jgi:hypothetical protein
MMRRIQSSSSFILDLHYCVLQRWKAMAIKQFIVSGHSEEEKVFTYVDFSLGFINTHSGCLSHKRKTF